METGTAPGKRTNSLAFARADCHTCATLNDQCDRRRPRCSTCLSKGRKCDGFAVSLSWDPKRMIFTHTGTSDGNNNNEAAAADSILLETSRPDTCTSAEPAGPPTRFRFMSSRSRPRKRRRANNSAAQRRSELQEQEVLASFADDGLPLLAGENSEVLTSNAQPNSDQIEHGMCKTTPHSCVCVSFDKCSENLAILFPEPRQASQSNDFDFNTIYGSILPSVFGSAPWVDFDPDEPFSTDFTELMSISRTPLSTTAGNEAVQEEAAPSSPSVRDFAPASFPDFTQGNVVPLTIVEANSSCAVRQLPSPTTVVDFSSNDYKWLFELCKMHTLHPLSSKLCAN